MDSESNEGCFIQWDAKIQDFESNPEANKTPRRTPMACTFCRKRKLKCDGRKTSCGNCDRRGIPCSYVPVSGDQA
ncbi:hypothetical protein C8Q75DRAFT_759107 [Abortiporus biennis]|nr:hypothetical protein C8Q75DRAFT_759107 [Abortiporus biennis]